jgi:hypothetical protein
LRIHLNTKSNDWTRHLINYNMCKHLSLSNICMEDIIKDQIHLR